MPQRVRLVLVAVFAMLFAAFLGAWLAAGDRNLTPDASAAYEGFIRPPGTAVPDYTLTDQDGKKVSRRLGKPAIYTFVYSTCEDTCPVMTQQIRGALDALGRDVPVYGVSVDPANDTPRTARTFLLKQHMTGRMTFLLGTRKELDPVWKAFGVQPQLDGEDHSANVVIVDGKGAQRIGFPASRLTVDDLVSDLKKLGA